MFESVLWFFDNVSLLILVIIGFVFFRISETLSKIRQTPIAFAISGTVVVWHFIHLYKESTDATIQSLWQPLIRCVATGAIMLGLSMTAIILAFMIWNTHVPWISRQYQAIMKRTRESQRQPEPPPIYDPEPPPISLPTPMERLTSQVRNAQDDYQDTVGVLTTIVSSLDEDEAEEIEMLAKQKLLAKLNDLLGARDV